MVKLTICASHTTHWHGQRGFRFALDIGRRRRHQISRLVLDSVHELPVTIHVKDLKRNVSSRTFACLHGAVRKVAISFKSYLIIINVEDAKEEILNQI